MDISDKELLEAIASKDTVAFRVFYDRYVQLLHIWALKRTGDSDIANDIVQNFWINFWINPSVIKVDDKGMARSFLMHYFSYRIFDYLRSAAAQILGDEGMMDNLKETANYSHIMEDLEVSEILEAINQVLTELPITTQEIFSLLWEQGSSVKEVAKQYGVSEKVIRMRYRKTLFAIRTKMQTMQSDDTTLQRASTLLSLFIYLSLLK